MHTIHSANGKGLKGKGRTLSQPGVRTLTELFYSSTIRSVTVQLTIRNEFNESSEDHPDILSKSASKREIS